MARPLKAMMCDCETIQTGLHFEAKLPPADHVSAEELMRKVKSGGESGWIFFFFFGGRLGTLVYISKEKIINHFEATGHGLQARWLSCLNSEPLHLGLFAVFFQGID